MRSVFVVGVGVAALSMVVGCGASNRAADASGSGSAGSKSPSDSSNVLKLDEASESSLATASALHIARVCDGQSYADAHGTALYNKACAMGDSESCSKLGVLYLCSDQKNGDQATAMFEKSCALHNADGCQLHAAALITGVGTQKRDTTRGLRVYTKACDEGSARACGTLGSIYMLVGTPETQARAMPTLDKACKLGNEDACGNLAVVEMNGLGGHPKNPEHAKTIAKASCEKQNAFSCSVYGVLHMTGEGGVKKDEAAGAKLFTFACSQNDAMGCTYLGVCEAQGQGVERNLQAAADSFKKGCDAGNGQACRLLAEISAHATPSTPSMTSSQSGGSNPTMF